MEKAGQKHMQQLEHQRRFWMLPEVHRNMSNCWKVMANSIKTRHNGKKLRSPTSLSENGAALRQI